MRFSPAPSPKRRPVVGVVTAAAPGMVEIVLDDGEVIRHQGVGTARDRDRCTDLLREAPVDWLYALPKLRSVILSAGADRWTGRMWRHTLSAVHLDAGPRVVPIHRAFDGVGHLEAVQGLMVGLDWLWGLGVPAGSLSGMAGRLWRRSLTSPVDLHYPEEGREAFYGGRQETPAGPVRADRPVMWDMAAAYPSSMAARPFPRRMIEVDPATTIQADQVGYVHAQVVIPDTRHGPLPVRIDRRSVCYVTSTGGRAIEGWWTWGEAAAARRAGCELVVRRCWAGLGTVDLFGPWWEMAAPGRQLPGPAGKLAKAVTSSLWGTFAMTGDRARTVRWPDPDGKRMVLVAAHATTRNRWAVGIAAEITSRVRVRLHDQALTHLDGVVHVDTDGVISSRRDAGPQAPGWALKRDMIEVDVRAPQVYRWRCPDCSAVSLDQHAPWHYSVAGAPTEGAAQALFARTPRRHAAPAVTWTDTTLPGMPLDRLVTVAPVAETVVVG